MWGWWGNQWRICLRGVVRPAWEWIRRGMVRELVGVRAAGGVTREAGCGPGVRPLVRVDLLGRVWSRGVDCDGWGALDSWVGGGRWALGEWIVGGTFRIGCGVPVEARWVGGWFSVLYFDQIAQLKFQGRFFAPLYSFPPAPLSSMKPPARVLSEDLPLLSREGTVCRLPPPPPPPSSNVTGRPLFKRLVFIHTPHVFFLFSKLLCVSRRGWFRTSVD